MRLNQASVAVGSVQLEVGYARAWCGVCCVVTIVGCAAEGSPQQYRKHQILDIEATNRNGVLVRSKP